VERGIYRFRNAEGATVIVCRAVNIWWSMAELMVYCVAGVHLVIAKQVRVGLTNVRCGPLVNVRCIVYPAVSWFWSQTFGDLSGEHLATFEKPSKSSPNNSY
jgi:hypothetical protein